jgi:hypothetical protein
MKATLSKVTRRASSGGALRRLLFALAPILVAACASSGQHPANTVAAPAESLDEAPVGVPEGAPDATTAQAARRILVTIKQAVPASLQRAGSTPKPYGGASRYKVTTRTRRTVARLAKHYSLQPVDEWPIEALGIHCVVFEIPVDRSREALLVELARNPGVESVQPMQIFEVLGKTYNDPFLHLQHGVESMQVVEAHRWSVGDGVTVAIVDSGVDRGHPELEGRVSVVEDFVSDRGSSAAADLHGTAVAGVIASAADNGIGIVGVAPRVRLMALRACWESEGTTESARCNSFTLAKAIAFAVEEAPDVLNLSLTGPPDPLLERLLQAALDRGIVVVAAGLENWRDERRFPSSIDGVIAVHAAVPEGDRLAVTGGADGWPLLLAPGKEILTLTPEGSYSFMSGSSFAAAHVSGITALLLELEPKLDAKTLHQLLLEASRQTEPAASSSAGMVNACAALARIVPTAECISTAAVD